MIEKHAFTPTYRKENGLWLLNVDTPELPVDDFTIVERNVAYIPAGEYGGNHKHPRTEAFVGIGELELIWQDTNGERHSELMSTAEENQLRLFIVRSMTPHVVINRGKSAAVLIEFADAAQHDVELVNLLQER